MPETDSRDSLTPPFASELLEVDGQLELGLAPRAEVRPAAAPAPQVAQLAPSRSLRSRQPLDELRSRPWLVFD